MGTIDLYRKAVRNNIIMAIDHPVRDDRHRPDVRLADHDRGLEPGPAEGHPQLDFYRVVSFFPYVVPAIAIGLIWSKMFDPSNGLLNGVLTRLGL